jgi:hypothetical protein
MITDSAYTSLAVAIQQELMNLARTGGGAVGDLIASTTIPPYLVLWALGLLVLGIVTRRLALEMS